MFSIWEYDGEPTWYARNINRSEALAILVRYKDRHLIRIFENKDDNLIELDRSEFIQNSIR
jgi:hypothetical protein